MKNKIYSKLFKFSNIKYWEREGSTNYVSKFYNEYKLEFHSEGPFWFYKIYKRKTIDARPIEIHKGLVTLQLGGKIMATTIMTFLYVIASLVLSQYKFHINYNVIVFAISLFILSYLALPIFNWSIYRTLRKVQYYINNKKRIEEKEEEEILMTEVVSIINKKIASDPKLARKTKLKVLNQKRWFSKTKE